MIIDTGNMDTIIAFLIALISAIIAWYQNREKNMIVQAYTPGTVESITPAVIAKLPERSWKMTDSTKRFLTFDCPVDVKADLLKQVAAAEASFLTDYEVNYPGGHSHVQYGLVYSGSGNCFDSK
jgi:acyl-homoserine lactone acylase PvdQ